MSNIDFIRKKRAVYTGLHPLLDESELMEAMILWESRYSDKPTFSVRYFIADLSKKLNHKVESKRLLVELVSSLGKSENELLPDPSAAVTAYRRRSGIGTSADFALPELEAFQVLVDKLLRSAKSHVSIDVAKFVSHNLDALDIAPELSGMLLEWLADENYRMRLPNVAVKDLRKVINLFYIGFCEYMGPVKADNLLAESVQSLKTNGGAIYSEIFNKLL